MMRRRDYLLGALLAASVSPLWAQTQSQTQTQAPAGAPRLALVVGNAGYKSAPLRSPLNDAADIAAALQGLGFAVQRETDLTDQRFQWAVEAFADKLRTSGAMGLVYLSGHGVSLGGSVRFVGISDQGVWTPDEVYRHSTDLAWVLGSMAKRRSLGASVRSPIFLIADIASDDPFAAASKPPDAQALGLSLARERDSGVFLSSTPGTVPGETKDGRNGLFTRHLVSALQTEGLSLTQVAARVSQGVRAETALNQIPWSTRVDLNFDQIVLKPAVLRDDPKARGRSARGG